MELKEILSTRRSIRKYSDKEVSKSTIEALLEATLKVPSSRNSHSTHLLVVRNSEIIEKLAEMRDYGSAFLKNAPVVILIMGDTQATDLWDINCAISATTMQLAATDLGLSTCWVHVDGRAHLQAEPDGLDAETYVRGVIDIPQSLKILCAMAVGYSDFTPAPLPPFDGSAHVKELE